MPRPNEGSSEPAQPPQPAQPALPAQPCPVCGRATARRDLVPGSAVREALAAEIIKDHPGWNPSQSICRADLDTYRTRYVHSLLESERGELSALEQEVLQSLETHDVLSRDVDSGFEQKWSLGQRLADRIATFGGSWAFLIAFGCFLAFWITLNAMIQGRGGKAVDPFPFILLNLVLSCLAAIQAPVIMMSQNRQEAKDRLRSQHDYQVNLRAELEIRQLHEKMDHLLSHQWERMAEMQEIQMELLQELGKRR